MSSALAAPAAAPNLGWMLAGFVVLVAGLAALAAGRRHGPLESPGGTRRALLYGLVYTLVAACFMRVLAPALAGTERSPWLLAVGDVMFVTLAIFVWVMALAEGRAPRAIGFRLCRLRSMAICLAMGLGAVVVFAFGPWRAILAGEVRPTTDTIVFAALFALVGSALPEEVLFRGYLMSSLNGRARRWARVALPALAFTASRSLRFWPGEALPWDDWLFYVTGVCLPLGLWWGLMRDLAGGSLWPALLSHALLEFGTTLASASPTGTVHHS
uniref:CPBP family intramembrane metalloprotease n=1 Tax=Eiseniibacteriota bacterium TaxID=2212470 RepID=A0A832I5A0_UNCEI